VVELFGGDWRIQRGSLIRESLHLYAFTIPSKRGRLAWLAENVPKLPGSGVIYVLTKPDADQVRLQRFSRNWCWMIPILIFLFFVVLLLLFPFLFFHFWPSLFILEAGSDVSAAEKFVPFYIAVG